MKPAHFPVHETTSVTDRRNKDISAQKLAAAEAAGTVSTVRINGNAARSRATATGSEAAASIVSS